MKSFVAIGLSAASLVLNIVGLAIPFWIYISIGDDKSYFGLWTSCQDIQSVKVCVSIPGLILTGAWKATRAFEILGMLVILAALVCALLKHFVMKDQALLPKVGGGCAIAAGILMIIGTVIFATMDGIVTSSLHAGFALCIIAGVVGIVAGVVMFLVSNGE